MCRPGCSRSTPLLSSHLPQQALPPFRRLWKSTQRDALNVFDASGGAAVSHRCCCCCFRSHVPTPLGALSVALLLLLVAACKKKQNTTKTPLSLAVDRGRASAWRTLVPCPSRTHVDAKQLQPHLFRPNKPRGPVEKYPPPAGTISFAASLGTVPWNGLETEIPRGDRQAWMINRACVEYGGWGGAGDT